MKKTPILLLLGCTAVFGWSFMKNDTIVENRQASEKVYFIESDSVFAMEAGSSSKMEITLGNTAQQNAASQRVKDYGAMMVRDHTAATQDLMASAGRANLMLRDTMLPKHSQHVQHLTGLTGAAFDKAYLNMMVEAHKDDIDEFEDAATKAQDTAIRGFASRQLPILKMHLDSARAIQARLK